VTDLADTLAALLADPLEQTHHRRLADRVAEEYADPRAELLRLVCAHKASDGPRLAYAAFCEANGEGERAEFVRVQCELARGPEGIHCSRVAISRQGEFDCRPIGGEPMPAPGERVTARVLTGVPSRRVWMTFTGVVRERRADEWGGSFLIDNALGRDWTAVLSARERELDGSTCLDAEVARLIAWGMRPSWGRGFVAAVICTAKDWLAHADALLAEHPVEHCTLTTRPECTRHIATAIAFRVLPAEWTADGEPCAFDTDEGLGAELRRKWPGVAFTLPPPAVGALLPQDGWACEERSDELGTERDDGAHRFQPALRYLELRLNLPHGPVVPIGTRFGPVVATDHTGARWECEAILTRATQNLAATPVTEYEAISVGAVHQVA
jgi:uncharacterized protein (TIGR02996 family)